MAACPAGVFSFIDGLALVAERARRIDELAGAVEGAMLAVPLVSNLTGTWITPEEATDPAYWARHLVSPVLFAPGLETLYGAGHRTFVELGPG